MRKWRLAISTAGIVATIAGFAVPVLGQSVEPIAKLDGDRFVERLAEQGPKGSANKRSREILAEACERGIDPIQVLFAAIEHFMKRAKETTGEEQDGHMLSAVWVAKEAAPFCHPRLRAVELTSSDSPPVGAQADMLLLGRMTRGRVDRAIAG